MAYLRVSELKVNAISVNKDGDWLAVGCGKGSEGQLIVWEWQSESYVMKQQSHAQKITAVVYSPDGAKLVTGAEDGKLSSFFVLPIFAQNLISRTSL